MDCLPDDELQRWLRKDAPFGDLTSRGLALGTAMGRLRFLARGAVRVAAIEEAARLFVLCGCQADVVLASGSDAEAASGVASEAARIVGALREQGLVQPLACTRKTWPGGRALAARAVWAGGAVMHRLGLSETLLVFPEHRVFIAAAD